jgi:hypothetical protein
MAIRIHTHAFERMIERGATEAEVISTILQGERFPAKFGRLGFRRNFKYEGTWRGRWRVNKQLEAYAVPQGDDWLVITVIVRYY